MKNFNLKHALGALALTAVIILAQSAFAAELVITTRFEADATRPWYNKFENTTPLSGYCADHTPSRCEPGEVSILVPGFMAFKEFDSNSSDLSKHTFITLDGTLKSVTLTDVNNPANKMTADFRWSFFGIRHLRTNAGDGDLSQAMNQTGYYPEGGCTPKPGSGNAGAYDHGWGVPERLVTCYRMLNEGSNYLGTVKIDHLSLGYTLSTPSPLSVSSGEYEGEVIYRVGNVTNTPGYFGLGADDYNGEEQIRIVIRATVVHAFKVDFPAGIERVALAPKGGWSQWINGGHVPEQLQKEVPFILTSSTGFKVTMQCEHQQGQTCGLKNTLTTDTVPVEVQINLPGFTIGSRPVSRQVLTTNPGGHVIDAPTEAIYNRRSTLQFQVKKPAVETMVKEPGSAWRGVVTLVFDTQVD